MCTKPQNSITMKERIIRPDEYKTPAKMPIIGKIKVGEKRKNNNGIEYPVSNDYFLARGKYEQLFRNAYEEKPNCIQVVFIDDENSCIERYEYRDNSGNLFAYGDGNEFKVWNSKKEDYVNCSMSELNVIDEVSKKCTSKIGWKVVLTLRFLIPKVRGIAGLWEFQTKGDASSIPQITASYDNLLQQQGFVKGIIFDLSVKFATSQKPGINRKYPVVTLVPNHSDENIKMIKESVFKIENPLKALE